MNSKEILIKMKLLDEGVLPARTGKELSQMMMSISEENQRYFKRKFRKKWRKIAKNNKDREESMGLGNKRPTQKEKLERVVRVYIHASKEI